MALCQQKSGIRRDPVVPPLEMSLDGPNGPTYLQLCFQQFWIIIDPIVRSIGRDPDVTLLGTVLIQATDLAKKVPFVINCKMEFGLSHTW